MIDAVFDCNVFVQALTGRGTARRCFKAVGSAVKLWCSEAILVEVIDVLSRPELRLKNPDLTDSGMWDFIAEIRRVAEVAIVVPKVFPLASDADDAMYLDLAIAAGAVFVVTRDNHLLRLMTANDLNAQLFRAAFPETEVLTPEPFLARLP